ncbi:DUF1801 domain-containing protein [Corynebacterium suicordis]|uniref:DUF1801 domain-containing protein n=1 Tax=Corynebacterium suicordis DSM 45110 TaxID=1121369 RepID=A0ABR9ZGI0_9CORY|nr:DUF1801 domain-containing protein [Corynebacterium suicordis]MBF4552513.1 DUF1801 domain-containing protein [Corynebacterium suicordis DSM 45110]MDR6278528.1 hypothetical protein [Corynebacterium suicordis]
MNIADIPGIAAPAKRALADKGYSTLQDLAGTSAQELGELHGVGPRVLERLQAALEKEDLSLSGDVPEPTDRTPTITKGHTGVTASDVKTRPTDRSPEQFIEELEWPRRVEHGRELLALFNQVTGAEPVMWGPTMIGYGEVHYVSPAGREGDWFQLGFSPRKASLSLYGLQGAPRSEELLAKLGKHKRGAGCVYVNKLEDIDMDVLAELVQHAWESDAQDC